MSSGFITENEVLEVRKKRQEEWERVRKADDPLERPEETYDHRSLFDRLQEQKQKKDLEYEEAHKLKNMIKGLDDDEIEFLDLIDRTKLAADRKKNIEEELELNDYRNRVASLQEKTLDKKLQSEINTIKPKPISNRVSQIKLLKGVLVKKQENKKRKLSDMEGNEDATNKANKELNGNEPVSAGDSHCSSSIDSPITVQQDVTQVNKTNIGLTCIGILPGLGCYNDSSSDASSSSDQDEEIVQKRSRVQIDLLGRKIIKKES